MTDKVRVYDARTGQLKRIEHPSGRVYLVMKNGKLVEPNKRAAPGRPRGRASVSY